MVPPPPGLNAMQNFFLVQLPPPLDKIQCKITFLTLWSPLPLIKGYGKSLFGANYPLPWPKFNMKSIFVPKCLAQLDKNQCKSLVGPKFPYTELKSIENHF